MIEIRRSLIRLISLRFVAALHDSSEQRMVSQRKDFEQSPRFWGQLVSCR
jgi:hypothetical protein